MNMKKHLSFCPIVSAMNKTVYFTHCAVEKRKTIRSFYIYSVSLQKPVKIDKEWRHKSGRTLANYNKSIFILNIQLCIEINNNA